jgi:hypothetical protein
MKSLLKAALLGLAIAGCSHDNYKLGMHNGNGEEKKAANQTNPESNSIETDYNTIKDNIHQWGNENGDFRQRFSQILYNYNQQDRAGMIALGTLKEKLYFINVEPKFSADIQAIIECIQNQINTIKERLDRPAKNSSGAAGYDAINKTQRS